MTFASILKKTAALAALALLPAMAFAQPVVVNPSFEANARPGGVGYLPNVNYITGWTASAAGVGLNTATGPFADNGIIPDGVNVALLQNAGATLTQDVAGFEAGKNYTLVVFANARNGAILPNIQVSVAFGAVIPDTEITQSGPGNPYTRLTGNFASPGDGTFQLEITNLEGGGDNTLLVDNILIVEQGAPQEIAVNKTALDFASVEKNTTKDLTLLITNLGGTALNVSSLALSGADAGAYSVVSPAGAFSVPELGGTQVVTVRFAPTAAATYNNATLTINSNDADEAAIPVALTGFAPDAPTIVNNSFEVDALGGFPGYTTNITGWTVTGPQGAGLNGVAGPFQDNGLIPDGQKVFFAQGESGIEQNVAGFVSGKTYRLMYFENRRNGAQPATAQALVAFGTVIPSHEVTTPVGAGNPYRLVSGDFASPGDGAFMLQIQSTFNTAAGDNTYLVDFVNIVEVGSSPDVHPSPGLVNFAVSEVGDPVERTFTLFNIGGSDLNVTGLTPAGAHGGDFAVVSPAGAFTVPSAGSQAVVVRFTPTAVGVRDQATLDIASNDPDEATFQLPLTGEGVAGVGVVNPSFEVDPTPDAPGYTTNITGWVVSGGGGFHNHEEYATFHDNGATPDGNNVAFLQGPGTFTQGIPGFKLDKEYTIRIDVNARSASTANAPFQMSLGGEFLFGTETPIEIAPVEAAGSFTVPFRRFEILKWTPPAAGTLNLVIAHVQPQGDTTMTFDNVYIAEHVNAASHWSIFQ